MRGQSCLVLLPPTEESMDCIRAKVFEILSGRRSLTLVGTYFPVIKKLSYLQETFECLSQSIPISHFPNCANLYHWDTMDELNICVQQFLNLLNLQLPIPP